ncbi:hypothetical protein [Streptomyces roseochromogenus]|uniref:Uncharacterized protein n=1 Tax=Streptomyces roseochromogenus subsp. oscitans DS 12.976 TaxID=1352936 RepID=V6KGJ0_STRRC|nr:hypothetical protein [Streptomyces roseochromogenus]EST30571.1 hypothetical protein M878_17800 [Streptomyces roseochromogenus subsp. oscitans DS 12.976]
MSDLRLEGTIFEDLKRTFSTIADRMDTARRTLRNTDGSVVGPPDLVNDVHAFADDWGYGIKQLGKHNQNAIKMINNIGSSFGQLDQQLAESMKAPKSGGVGKSGKSGKKEG